jgi:hypothetical protein
MGTGIPQFGQPPFAFTRFCIDAAHIKIIATVATEVPTMTANITPPLAAKFISSKYSSPTKLAR